MGLYPTLYIDRYAPSSRRFAEAFDHGIGDVDEPRTTVDLTAPDQSEPPRPPSLSDDCRSVAMFVTPRMWPVLRQAQAEGRTWYYGDHGYFGRKTFFRITKNAYQYQGTMKGCPDRFAHFGRRIKSWRTNGSHILVCPNSSLHFGPHGEGTAEEWVDKVVAELKKHTDRRILVRWKPIHRTSSQEENARRFVDGIENALADAWACVTYSSAAALDALIMGIPIFVLATFSAAYEFGEDDLSLIEDPCYPEGRAELMARLASNQWTVSEIKNGKAWKALRPTMKERFRM